MDKITKEARSKNMSNIRAKNTKPEIILRKALFKDGLRYRIHYNLPGKPDIVFLSKRIAIFVNGCFWHNHNCEIDHNPKSNRDFWISKILNNKKRDEANYKKIEDLGWYFHIAWECNIYKNLDNEKKIIKAMLNKTDLY